MQTESVLTTQDEKLAELIYDKQGLRQDSEAATLVSNLGTQPVDLTLCPRGWTQSWDQILQPNIGTSP